MRPQGAVSALRRIGFALALMMVLPAVAAEGEGGRNLDAIIAPTIDFTAAEPFERNPGGAGTSRHPPSGNAFSYPSANLSFERRADFFIGNGFFKRLWVSSPSSTTSADGLGPLYNARSCQRCHLKDGRGHPPQRPEDSAVSMFLRLSVPPRNPLERELILSRRQNVIPEPRYGDQLQDFAVAGLLAEGRMTIDHELQELRLKDGTIVSLARPVYGIAELAYGPLDPEVMLSPRIAPPMIGLGLLEQIDEKDILGHADPDDTNNDGISGRANQVWSVEHERVMLGRFGWKAGNPTLMQQASSAMVGDIGISNPLYLHAFGDCTTAQKACRVVPAAGGPEAGSDVMDKILFYSRHLAVPARRDIDDRRVLAGKQLFYQADCIACHVPKFITRRGGDDPSLSFQLIWPYSDLLLHDMGEGLADGRPEGAASGREWRTPPLWGIGLTKEVNGHTSFLHDGRARSLLEAILWHGGEAEAARNRVAAMTAEERDALIAFLNSL